MKSAACEILLFGTIRDRRILPDGIQDHGLIILKYSASHFSEHHRSLKPPLRAPHLKHPFDVQNFQGISIVIALPIFITGRCLSSCSRGSSSLRSWPFDTHAVYANTIAVESSCSQLIQRGKLAILTLNTQLILLI